MTLLAGQVVVEPTLTECPLVSSERGDRVDLRPFAEHRAEAGLSESPCQPVLTDEQDAMTKPLTVLGGRGAVRSAPRVCAGVWWCGPLFRVVVGWGVTGRAGLGVVAWGAGGWYPRELWGRGWVVGVAPAFDQGPGFPGGVEDLAACVAGHRSLPLKPSPA